MLVTEKEAAEKWCPMGRYLAVFRGDDGKRECAGSFNRGADDSNLRSSNCIGSRCMAFRWAPDSTLTLPDGQILILSPADEDLRDGVWWDGRYAKGKSGYLHRLIATRECGQIPEGMFVDHIDGDPLNNRRGNLRVVTKAQNAANAAARGGVSSYRGVFQRHGKWAAQIAKEGVRTSLGTFETEREAAAAYDEAAKSVHGEYARLNLEPAVNSGRLGYCGAFGKAEP